MPNTLTLGRLTKRSEFLYVREGRYKAAGGVVVQVRRNPDAENPAHSGAIRAGFTATKKIGNAVVRNRAKRRLREAARRVLPEFGRPGHDYVFIARQSTVQRSFNMLLKDVENALLSLA
jgi:ribonuclease P protein component